MFDELAILYGSRLMLLAGISYTLWSLHGIFWRGWSVGTMFFWMWWELLLSGISTIVLIYRWDRVTKLPPLRGDSPAGTALAMVIALFFATLFTAVALAAEGISVPKGTLGGFIHDREMTMGLIAFLYLLVHLMTAYGRRFPEILKYQIAAPLYNRVFPVLGLYGVLIFDHHWHGRRELDSSHRHQLLMAGSMLGFKLLLELRQFFVTPR
jgi:hypothetical protein